MRFLVDAQLPPGLADFLREAGHQAEHVNLIGLATASDREIWDYASRNGAAIFRKDEDFVDFARTETGGPAVIWIRLGNTTNRALRTVLERVLPEVLAGLSDGERLIEIA